MRDHDFILNETWARSLVASHSPSRPAKNMTSGAVPHLHQVFYWSLADFREWAEQALVAVRDLRRAFVEPGDLVWRAEAAEKLSAIRVDAAGLAKWLSDRPARDSLKSVPEAGFPRRGLARGRKSPGCFRTRRSRRRLLFAHFYSVCVEADCRAPRMVARLAQE